MNKEQQELSETTMEIGQPPHSVQVTYSHVITALCTCGWFNGGLEAGLVQAVAAEHLSMGAQLVTALEQRDAAVIGRKLRQQQFEDMDRMANDAITQRDAAEAQLLDKDALIASLNAEIKGYQMAYDYGHDCDEQLYVELGVPLCGTHQRHCWAHVASWLVENKKSQESIIASLKAEISKQNKAEDELLATGEKLAEERK